MACTSRVVKPTDFTAGRSIWVMVRLLKNFTLSEHIKGKKSGFCFSNPLDFTFVCPSELIAFGQSVYSRIYESREAYKLSVFLYRFSVFTPCLACNASGQRWYWCEVKILQLVADVEARQICKSIRR